MGFNRLKAMDFYRKIPRCAAPPARPPILPGVAGGRGGGTCVCNPPLTGPFARRRDLTEGTLAGAGLSAVAAVGILALLVMEFRSFRTPDHLSSIVVDRSPEQLMKVQFNVSFPSMPCEFATVDASDNLGSRRINLEKTVRKVPIDKDFRLFDEHAVVYENERSHEVEILHKEMLEAHTIPAGEGSLKLEPGGGDYDEVIGKYPKVLVYYGVTWCPYCRRLDPVFEAAAAAVHRKYRLETDGRILLARINCEEQQQRCALDNIHAFPTIRIFENGAADFHENGEQFYRNYRGIRSVPDITAFVDSILSPPKVPGLPAGANAESWKKLPQAKGSLNATGCNLSGFVIVKKVPGTLHFHSKSEYHTLFQDGANLTHYVNEFSFGEGVTVGEYRVMKSMHPLGLAPDWKDKLSGHFFVSDKVNQTHEHYMQVVTTSVKPLGRSAGEVSIHEYIAHSHSYEMVKMPAAKFDYDFSPMQVVVSQKSKEVYHFLTSLCAIVGGAFTVAGIFDSGFYQASRVLKKEKMGKLG